MITFEHGRLDVNHPGEFTPKSSPTLLKVSQTLERIPIPVTYLFELELCGTPAGL